MHFNFFIISLNSVFGFAQGSPGFQSTRQFDWSISYITLPFLIEWNLIMLAMIIIICSDMKFSLIILYILIQVTCKILITFMNTRRNFKFTSSYFTSLIHHCKRILLHLPISVWQIKTIFYTKHFFMNLYDVYKFQYIWYNISLSRSVSTTRHLSIFTISDTLIRL